MERQDVKPGLTVINKKTGRVGVMFLGFDYNACSKDEVPIVYKGDDSSPNHPGFTGTDPRNLEPYSLQPQDLLTIGHVKDVCKMGQGEKTCRYLVLGRDGFECARAYGDLSVAWGMDDRAREDKSVAKSVNCGGRYGSTKINPENI